MNINKQMDSIWNNIARLWTRTIHAPKHYTSGSDSLVLDEDDFASDSAEQPPSQQSTRLGLEESRRYSLLVGTD